MPEPNNHFKKDPLQELSIKYQEFKKNKKKANILVCGYTGTGKSTLIQSICGKDVVPDDKIGHGKPMTQSYDYYEGPSINIYDSRGLEAGDKEEDNFINDTNKLLRTLQETNDADRMIHLVWYCIQGPGARVMDCDLRLIKETFKNTLVVITKKDITKPIQLEKIIDVLRENGISEDRIVAIDESDNNSHINLVDQSLKNLPNAYKDAFVAGQIVDLDKKKDRAAIYIHTATAAAAAAGAIPLPFSDALPIGAAQGAMIFGITDLYGLDEERTKAMILPMIAGQTGVLAATSLVKLIPGLGSIVQAAVAASITEGIGWYLQNHCEQVLKAHLEGIPGPSFSIDLELLRTLLPRVNK